MAQAEFNHEVWEAEFWFALLLHRDDPDMRRQIQDEMLRRKPVA